MKEKLTRNIGLKILSVILAGMFWLVITNVNDPVISKPFDNVRVEILNADEIAALDQIYEIIEGETIDFTVAARRSIAEDLTVSDFKVTADLSKLSEVYTVSINISCPGYEDEIIITDGKNQVLKVNLEEIASKQLKVNVEQIGEPADGFYVGEKSTNTLLTVSGPKTKIERIAKIVVAVDVSNMAMSFRTVEEPRALDEEGNEIDASNLTFSEETVAINIHMYRTKEIPLDVITTGSPAEGYVATKVEFEPKKIMIAAEDELLRNTKELVITEDISGVRENVEKEIDLQAQLENGVVLVGDNHTVTVNITIEKAETKDVTFWPGDIEIKNKPEGIGLVNLTTGPILVRLSGPSEEVKKVNRDTLKPYVDLTDYSSGTYSVDVKVELDDNITLVNQPVVNLYLMMQ